MTRKSKVTSPELPSEGFRSVGGSFWLEALKVLGILATVAASALGSYRAAKSDARSEADASYAALRQAVEQLGRTQEMIWDVVMKYPAAPSKSLGDLPSGESPRPYVGLRPLPHNLELLLSGKREGGK